MAKINGGYIVLARKIMDNSSWQALNEAGKLVMITLLMLANHKDRKWYNPLTKQEVMIKRGQCVTGRKSLAKQCRIGEQSIRTALTLLKSTNFLTIEPTSRFSIITICNYEHYQNPKNYINQVIDQEDNQVLTKFQPSPNQVLTTNNNDNNDKNEKNEIIKDILSDLNLVLGTSYKPTTLKTREFIYARLNEGFTVEDFKTVHRKMLRTWGADERMVKFLRPITLYSPKFESYLNQKAVTTKLTQEGVKAYLVGQEWLKQKEVVDVG